MKPIIIYENEECKTITMLKERFEKLINDAYENGHQDASPIIQYVPYNNYPITSPLITYGTVTLKQIDLTPIITCDYPQVSYTTAQSSK